MAKIITRMWTSRGPTGRRVKHVSYGYDGTIAGKRERRFSSEWRTEADALAAAYSPAQTPPAFHYSLASPIARDWAMSSRIGRFLSGRA